MKAFRKLGKTTTVKYGQKIGGMGEKNEGSNRPIFVRREIRESRGGGQCDEASEPDGHTCRAVPLPSCSCAAKPERGAVLVDFGHSLAASPLPHVVEEGPGPDDVSSSASLAPASHLSNYTSASLGAVQVLWLYLIMP